MLNKLFPAKSAGEEITDPQAAVLLDLENGPVDFEKLANAHDDRSIRAARAEGLIISRMDRRRYVAVVSLTAQGEKYVKDMEVVK